MKNFLLAMITTHESHITWKRCKLRFSLVPRSEENFTRGNAHNRSAAAPSHVCTYLLDRTAISTFSSSHVSWSEQWCQKGFPDLLLEIIPGSARTFNSSFLFLFGRERGVAGENNSQVHADTTEMYDYDHPHRSSNREIATNVRQQPTQTLLQICDICVTSSLSLSLCVCCICQRPATLLLIVFRLFG